MEWKSTQSEQSSVREDPHLVPNMKNPSNYDKIPLDQTILQSAKFSRIPNSISLSPNPISTSNFISFMQPTPKVTPSGQLRETQDQNAFYNLSKSRASVESRYLFPISGYHVSLQDGKEYAINNIAFIGTNLRLPPTYSQDVYKESFEAILSESKKHSTTIGAIDHIIWQQEAMVAFASPPNIMPPVTTPKQAPTWCLLEQPFAAQRRCYHNENRMILPNPLVICTKSYKDPQKKSGEVESFIGSVKVSLVNESGNLAFADEAPLGGILEKQFVGSKVEFNLKVYCVSGKALLRLKFEVTFSQAVIDEPHVEEVFSEPFRVVSKKKTKQLV